VIAFSHVEELPMHSSDSFDLSRILASQEWATLSGEAKRELGLATKLMEHGEYDEALSFFIAYLQDYNTDRSFPLQMIKLRLDCMDKAAQGDARAALADFKARIESTRGPEFLKLLAIDAFRRKLSIGRV
jgi:hypothetical protein